MNHRRLLLMIAAALQGVKVMVDKDKRFLAYNNKILSCKNKKENNNGA
ncbi:MAG: hypothetical protein U0H79_08620 [Eubacterium sp.]|nr:hypothetical protein [Eubacterium sp.]